MRKERRNERLSALFQGEWQISGRFIKLILFFSSESEFKVPFE
jgi:hypothetical protein